MKFYNKTLNFNTNTLNFENSSKTLATLGQGNINIKDIENSSELTRLNTNTLNINKDLYSSFTGTKVDATLDTRLLTESGRKQIKDDLYTASAITNAIEQIASNDKVNITDFFDETKKNVDVYNAMKTKIANDKTLSKYLQDPNLNPEDKQNMLQKVALSVMQELKYIPNDIKLMSTEETGRNDLPVMGYYDPDTQISLINDINNNSTKDLLVSLGHEITHDMDKQDNKFISNDTDQNTYATNFGNNLAFYTDKALYIVDDKSLASTNSHNQGKVTEYSSVFNTDYILKENNQLFTKMDKDGALVKSGAVSGGWFANFKFENRKLVRETGTYKNIELLGAGTPTISAGGEVGIVFTNNVDNFKGPYLTHGASAKYKKATIGVGISSTAINKETNQSTIGVSVNVSASKGLPVEGHVRIGNTEATINNTKVLYDFNPTINYINNTINTTKDKIYNWFGIKNENKDKDK